MGDKEPDFCGSKQWIGAVGILFVFTFVTIQEISMCLQVLYGVDCKVLHVNSGSRVLENVPQLVSHFETQGTPVMIGSQML